MSVKAIEKKKESVKELAQKFEKAKTIIAFDYPGLTVFDLTNLRKNLHDKNCEIKIFKNNISKRAAESLGYKNFAKDFVGAKALAISYDDVVVGAKALSDYAKDNSKVVITSGVVENLEVDKAYIEKLANIPSKDVLLTQLAVGLLSPVRSLAIGLNMLKEIKEKENN